MALAQDAPLSPDDTLPFLAMRTQVEALLQLTESGERITLGGKGRWKTKKERRYREWCLGKYLFLNPLNDLGDFAEAATDVLCLPPVVVDSSEGHFILSLTFLTKFH